MISAFKKMAGFEKPAVVMPVVRPAPGFAGWPDRKPGLAAGIAHLPPRDARWVQKLMDKAAQSPTGRAALAWALAHDVRFELTDDQRVVASYMPGTGTLYLRRGWWTTPGPETLVHEIRHAWQDFYGLIPSYRQNEVLTGDLGRQLIQQAIFEADAHAHAMMVRRELRHGVQTPDQSRTVLTEGFINWFADRAVAYHVRALMRVALGDRIRNINEILGKSPEEEKITPAPGIDPWSTHEIDQLGRSFAGVNYLAGLDASARDAMRETMLTPSAALAAFNPRATRASYTGQENALRKIQSRERLKTPLKRLPLPE